MSFYHDEVKKTLNVMRSKNRLIYQKIIENFSVLILLLNKEGNYIQIRHFILESLFIEVWNFFFKIEDNILLF